MELQQRFSRNRRLEAIRKIAEDLTHSSERPPDLVLTAMNRVRGTWEPYRESKRQGQWGGQEGEELAD